MSKNQPGPETRRKIVGRNSVFNGKKGAEQIGVAGCKSGRDRIRTCDPALIKRML